MAQFTLDDIQTLLHSEDDQVLSLCLLVDPADKENQASTPAWEIWLKNSLRDIESALDESDQEVWMDTMEWLDTFLSDYRPSGKTLVVFFGPETNRILELPMRLQNRAHFGKPLVTPLLWTRDEYENYLVVRVHQDHARFLHVYLGQGDTTESIQIDLDFDWGQKTMMPATAGDSRSGFTSEGSNRDAFNDMIAEHVKRFYKEVAQRTRSLVKFHKADRIILGGNEQAAYAVRDMLHQKTAAMVVDVVKLPSDASEHDVVEQILPVALAYERQYENTLLDEIIDQAKSGRRGALGYDDVLQALNRHQVDLLVAPWPLKDDDIARTLPYKALESGSRIELVHGEVAERLREEGGIAARLYYTVPEAT